MRIKPHYQKHPDPELNGNPLAEALQPILCPNEVRRLIDFSPKFADDFHTLSRIYQNLNIRRIAEIFVAPTISTLLYDKLFELILDGYRYRNPLTVKMTRFLYELASRGELIGGDDDNKIYEVVPPGMTTAPGSIFSGPTGTGKTSVIRAVLGIIPQVISHSAYGSIPSFQQDQIVWISFDAPATPSPKALCLNFMKAVDQALGIERYFTEFSRRSDNTSVDLHILKVQEVAANHFIGIVHFDEMQFFLKYAKIKNSPNLQILEAMFNKLGIPIIISTTDEGLPLISADPQTKRRMLSEQHFKLKPLKYNTPAFKDFINAIFLRQIWGVDDVLNTQSEFIKKFYELSAGLQAVMIRLSRLHLYYSIQKGGTPFDAQLLEQVFDSQFHYMKGSLAALRVGDFDSFEKKIPKNPDGSVAWSDEAMDSTKESGDVGEEKATTSTQSQKKNTSKSPAKPVQAFHNPALIGGV